MGKGLVCLSHFMRIFFLFDGRAPSLAASINSPASLACIPFSARALE